MGKFDVLPNLILKKMQQVNTVTHMPEMRKRSLAQWECHVMGSVASMCTAQALQCQPQNPTAEQLVLLGGGLEGGGEGAEQWWLCVEGGRVQPGC